jgi:HAD superfamily hydrolase (TIGR01509 family)
LKYRVHTRIQPRTTAGIPQSRLTMQLGALFDWDGVVIDSSQQHAESWELLAAELGKPLPHDHFLRGFGMKNQVIIPRILWWTEDPVEIHRYSLRKEELYREIVRARGIAPLPGVVALLQMLQDHGVPCAVASSTHRENIETIFDAIGVRAYFAAVVTAEDVAHGKPDPEVFLKGAAKIGRDPRHCVVFEDAHVGIEAGLAAGAKVIAVATTNPLESLGKADLAVASLQDVGWQMICGLFRRPH